jgi:hypothetical protein
VKRIEDRPDAFLPDLARSLGAMSDELAAMERYVQSCG